MAKPFRDPEIADLERKLRVHMRDPNIKWDKFKSKVWAGHIDDALAKTKRVRIDPYWYGPFSTVIHELIHAECEKFLLPFGKAEEVLVEALEARVTRYIRKNTAKSKWWRKHIEEALGLDE